MFRRQGETYDEYEKRIMRTADILFPAMKDKKDKNNMIAADMKIPETADSDKIKSQEWENDKDFNDVMKYLYPREGKYSNRKEDLHLTGTIKNTIFRKKMLKI